VHSMTQGYYDKAPCTDHVFGNGLRLLYTAMSQYLLLQYWVGSGAFI